MVSRKIAKCVENVDMLFEILWAGQMTPCLSLWMSRKICKINKRKLYRFHVEKKNTYAINFQRFEKLHIRTESKYSNGWHGATVSEKESWKIRATHLIQFDLSVLIKKEICNETRVLRAHEFLSGTFDKVPVRTICDIPKKRWSARPRTIEQLVNW